MMGVVIGCSQSDLRGQEVLFSEMAERLHQGVLLSWWNRSAGGLTSSQVLQLELRKPAGLQGEARLQQNTTDRKVEATVSKHPEGIGYLHLETKLLFSQIFLCHYGRGESISQGK